MGGQKGIALFYAAFSKLVNLSLISTINNAAPEHLHGKFLPILPSGKSRYVNPLLFFKIKKNIKEHCSSHLIIEHPYFGWLAVLLKKTTKVKLVVHSHNIESMRFKTTGKWWWKLLWHYEKYTHRHADVNFFISDEDRSYAIRHFGLQEKRCVTITYGFEMNKPPTLQEKQSARAQLCTIYGIPAQNRILFFNGTLDYPPNLDALKIILEKINPLLLESGLAYTILICGKNLPENLDGLKAYASKNIRYAGFVKDITVFFKGADLFINPVTDGGGIKTKLVEALGYDLSSISTVSGAIGVPEELTDNKLIGIEDGNWEGFAEAILHGFQGNEQINRSFFHHFQWNNIAEKAVKALNL